MAVMARFLFLFLSLFYIFSLQAKEKTFHFYIEWKNVEGANGYIVQLKEKNSDNVKEQKLSSNSIEFVLPIGYYEYRITAVNKFGKPSHWTAWEEFYVEKDRPKEVYKKMEAEKNEKKVSVSFWKYMIPGLTQYQNGDKGKAFLWIAWFSALAYTGNQQRLAGNHIADDPFNDPKNLAIISFQASTSLDVYYWMRRDTEKQKYNERQNNQWKVAGIALTSYLLQILHARSYSETITTSFYLYPQFHSMDRIQPGSSSAGTMNFGFEISVRF